MRQPRLVSSSVSRPTSINSRLVNAKRRLTGSDLVYVIVGIVLALLVVAYLLGDYTEEIRRKKQVSLTEKRLGQLYSHLAMCKSDSEIVGSIIKDNITASEKRLLEKKVTLTTEYDTFKNSISLESAALQSCEEKVNGDHSGTIKDVIAEIRESQDKVKELIEVAKKAREIYRGDMKSLIKAYELEMIEVMEKISNIHVVANPNNENGTLTTLDRISFEQAKEMRQNIAIEAMKHGIAVLNREDIAILVHAMKVQKMRDSKRREQVSLNSSNEDNSEKREGGNTEEKGILGKLFDQLYFHLPFITGNSARETTLVGKH